MSQVALPAVVAVQIYAWLLRAIVTEARVKNFSVMQAL